MKKVNLWMQWETHEKIIFWHKPTLYEIKIFSELHDLHTPRSITLSDMGSEIDVDQSLNLRGLYCYKYNDCMETASEIVINAISGAKDIINHQSQLNNSDSGTDSFSEQMVQY